MPAYIQAEINDWIKCPMKQGKLYYGICDREVIEDKFLHSFFDADEINDVIETVDAISPIVFLEKKITRQSDNAFGEKRYQTFIKVLTATGSVGWIIWFKNEWKEVKHERDIF